MGIYKKYVDVIARHYADGRTIPLAIWWSEGRLYEIDRVLDVRPCASLKAGGAGIRYTCRIQGHEKYIWREEDRWFVEAKGNKINTE